DSEILAEVYLELIGGRQPDLSLNPIARTTGPDTSWRPSPRPTPLPTRLTEVETIAHATFVAKLGATAIWLKRT
ncbi:MAG: DNA polymerase III subunit epsilon, partial [Pseudorhodobacter sp.]|nr:DNA polymerase III subunit epsilon [Pseudorhodobacter sp.]